MRSRAKPTFVELARRRQILQGAIELIAEQGFVNASTARIAERVGVAKSAILYYFATKDDLVAAIVQRIFEHGAQAIVPAVLAEDRAAAKLSAYIRANCAFIDTHRTESVALFEIMTSFRSSDGLRLDQAIARAVAAEPPGPEMALLDPYQIVEDGLRAGEFSRVTPLFVKNAIRGALDGAAAELARDISYDVVGYGEELIEIFGRGLERRPGRKP